MTRRLDEQLDAVAFPHRQIIVHGRGVHRCGALFYVTGDAEVEVVIGPSAPHARVRPGLCSCDQRFEFSSRGCVHLLPKNIVELAIDHDVTCEAFIDQHIGHVRAHDLALCAQLLQRCQILCDQAHALAVKCVQRDLRLGGAEQLQRLVDHRRFLGDAHPIRFAKGNHRLHLCRRRSVELAAVFINQRIHIEIRIPVTTARDVEIESLHDHACGLKRRDTIHIDHIAKADAFEGAQVLSDGVWIEVRCMNIATVVFIHQQVAARRDLGLQPLPILEELRLLFRLLRELAAMLRDAGNHVRAEVLDVGRCVAVAAIRGAEDLHAGVRLRHFACDPIDVIPRVVRQHTRGPEFRRVLAFAKLALADGSVAIAQHHGFHRCLQDACAREHVANVLRKQTGRGQALFARLRPAAQHATKRLASPAEHRVVALRLRQLRAGMRIEGVLGAGIGHRIDAVLRKSRVDHIRSTAEAHPQLPQRIVLLTKAAHVREAHGEVCLHGAIHHRQCHAVALRDHLADLPRHIPAHAERAEEIHDCIEAAMLVLRPDAEFLVVVLPKLRVRQRPLSAAHRIPFFPNLVVLRTGLRPCELQEFRRLSTTLLHEGNVPPSQHQPVLAADDAISVVLQITCLHTNRLDERTRPDIDFCHCRIGGLANHRQLHPRHLREMRLQLRRRQLGRRSSVLRNDDLRVSASVINEQRFRQCSGNHRQHHRRDADDQAE